MKTALVATIALTLGISLSASATSVIVACPTSGASMAELFRESSGVVVATPLAVSIRAATDAPHGRRSVLWKSNESWKGPYKGSTFTTRENIRCDLLEPECGQYFDWEIAQGRPMLLFLVGKEPYRLGNRGCTPTDFLENSMRALEEIFKLRRSWQDAD